MLKYYPVPFRPNVTSGILKSAALYHYIRTLPKNAINETNSELLHALLRLRIMEKTETFRVRRQKKQTNTDIYAARGVNHCDETKTLKVNKH